MITELLTPLLAWLGLTLTQLLLLVLVLVVLFKD